MPAADDHADIARSPAERILELTALIGEAEMAAWCAGLLDGSITYDDPRRPPITWLGGRHAAALKVRAEMMLEIAAGIDVIIVITAGKFLIRIVFAYARNKGVSNENAVGQRPGVDQDGPILHRGGMNGWIGIGFDQGCCSIKS